MKLAVVQSGRNSEVFTLLNGLNKFRDIDLYLFTNTPTEEIGTLQFDHQVYEWCGEGLRIQDAQPLWLNQFYLRERWRRILDRHLSDDFDLVISMNDLGPPAVSAARSAGIPSILLVRNLAWTGKNLYPNDRTNLQNFRNLQFGRQIQYPFLMAHFRSLRTAFHETTVTVPNSEWVASELERNFGANSQIVYPPITLDDYRVEYDPNGKIGMLAPRKHRKGGDIFLNIAEEMPVEEFVVGGSVEESLRPRINSLDNVEYLGWVEQVRDFYRKCKLVVVPSREEAFGRVAAEPMVSGIPVVVSNRGGLPEVVGETGETVDEIESVPAWKEAIETALNDHDPEAQIQRVQKFSTREQVDNLDGIIESLL